MLGNNNTTTNVSTTPDTDSVVGGRGTLLSTVIARHENATGKVTALAPKSESGSSAVVKSGKTVVSTIETVKQLEKEITIYTSSYGKKFTKQHPVGSHIKDLLKRILDFSKGGKHEILKELEEDKHLGTFESHDGHKVHVVKFIRMLEDEEGAKASAGDAGVCVSEEQRAEEEKRAKEEGKALFNAQAIAREFDPLYNMNYSQIE